MSRRMRRLALLGTVALALAACSASTPSATPRPGPSPTAGPSASISPTGATGLPSSRPSPQPSATPVEDDPERYRSDRAESLGYWETFRSPSGNVRCGLSSESDSDWVTCVVLEHTWATPACPRTRPAELFLDTAEGKPATLRCEEPEQLDPDAPVLPYGHALQEIAITCTSSQAGMVCENGRHGFEVARGRYRVF